MERILVLTKGRLLVLSFFVLVLSLMMGCSGGSGTSGSASSAPAAQTTIGTVSGGTISGTVETSTGTPLSGINVYAYLATNSATGYQQLSPNQNYQNAKAMLTNQPAYSTQTAGNGTYSLSVPQAVYTIVFTDPNGNFTIGTALNIAVVNGGTQTVNAGMGSSVTVGETTKAEPTVTVSTTYYGTTSGVGTSSSSVNPLSLFSTGEVGYGNTVALTATATSPTSLTSTGLTPSYSYAWTATYPVNPGGSAKVTAGTGALANTATVTLPTIQQALAGVLDATNGGKPDSVTGLCDAGMYVSNTVSNAPTNPTGTGCYDVTPYVPDPRIGVLPITADTRGTVSTTVTVSDGLGGSTAVSISSNSAGTQTGLDTVPVGEPVYINSGHNISGSTANWSLTTKPSNSAATILNPTFPVASFIPDVAGTYVVKDSSNTSTENTLTIYAGTWFGVVTGGGETSATVPASGFNAFTTPGGGTSQLATGIWAGSAGSYTDWPYVTPNPLCQDCHSSSPYTTAGLNGFTLIALDKFTPWTGTAHATFMARGMNGITSNTGSCLTCHSVGFDQAVNAGANGGFSYIAMLDGWAYPATRQAGNWKALVGETQYAGVLQLSNIQCENCHGPQTSGGHESGMAGSSTVPITGAGTRVSYSAEDCGICHADGTTHHIYSEWLASPNPGISGPPITINAISINGTTISSTFTNVAVVAGNSGHGHSHYGQASYTVNAADTSISPGHATSNSPSCSRCHTAEGFAAYVNQLKLYTGQSQYPSVAGVLESQYVPSSITGGNAALLGTTVWTPDNAHPQTCTACHDPHNDALPNQLRVYDSVPMTIVGVGVSGLGKGAICTVCHNSRNGVQCDTAHPPQTNGVCATGSVQSGPTFLHEDTDPVAPTYMDTPHDNTQAEVFLGRDAFFMGRSLPMLSKHANVADSCVGCHMTLNPQTYSSHGSTATATHMFYILDGDRPTLCANCHGGTGDVSGQGIVSQTQNQEAMLTAALGSAMQIQLPVNLAANHATSFYAGSTLIPIANVASVTFFQIPATSAALTVSGSATFYFYNSAGTLLGSAGLSAITYDSKNLLPVFSTNGIFKRAVWNYQLIGKDYSNGIHNPSFVNAVMSNTISAVTSGYTNPLTNTALPY